MAVTVEQALSHLQGRQRQRQEEADREARRLLALLPQTASLLREQFGCAEVWLFGSLATGTHRPGSDVDLAVIGLRSETFFEALTALMEHLSAPVDLVQLEGAPESLTERVRAEGLAL